MSLLKDRLFALLCLLFSASSVIAVFLGTAGCFIACAVLVVFAFSALMLCKSPSLRKILIASFAVMLAGLLAFSVRVGARRSLPSEYGMKQVDLSATVYDVTDFDGGGYGVYLDTDTINGKHKRFRVYFSDFSNTAKPVPGDTVSVCGVLCSIDDKYFSDRDYAVGCFSEIVSDEGMTITGHRNTVRYHAYTLRSKCVGMIAHTANEESAGLLSALLLGDRSHIPDRLLPEFRRLGISHLLALSGLHLSVLSFGLVFILKKLRMPKCGILITTVVFILFYTVITGMPYSIIRAAVMTFAACLAWFSGRQGDSLTSLLFAAALIITVEPGAVYDSGFWLSVSATFGIVTGTMLHKRKARPQGKPAKLLRSIFAPMLLTLYASLGTLPFTCFFFGEFAVPAPLANVVFAPLFYVMLWLAMLVLAVSPIPHLGAAVGKAASLFCGAIIRFCGLFSDKLGLTVSLTYIPVTVLVFLLTSALLLFLFLSHGRLKRVAGMASSSLLLVLILCTGICNAMTGADTSVTYFSAQNGDFLVLNSGSKTIMIDSSPGTSNCLREAASQLSSLHITEIDTLVLTHYNTGFTAGLKKLFSSKKIRSMSLPRPMNEKQRAAAVKIKNVADTYGIGVSYYAPDLPCIGADMFTVQTINEPSDAGSYINIGVYIKHGDTDMVFAGAQYMTYKYSVTLAPYMSRAEYIVIGSYPHTQNQEIFIPALSELNREIYIQDAYLPLDLSPSAEAVIDSVRLTYKKDHYYIKLRKSR